MTATAQECLTRRRKQPANESYGRFHRTPRCPEESASARLPRDTKSFTDAGRELARTLRIAALEREMALLKAEFRQLLIETELADKEALEKLELHSPSNATLRLGAERSEPPEDLAATAEERPW